MGFFDFVFLNNTGHQWLMAFAIIVGAFVAGHALVWVNRHLVRKIVKRTLPKIDDIIVDSVESPLGLIVVLVGIRVALRELTIPLRYLELVNDAYVVLIILNITWILSRFCTALIIEYVAPKVKLSGKRVNSRLIPTLQKTSQTVIWGFGIVVALNNTGYDVKALIAGLGIGGLALALAAKDTVTNFFGGFTIFADKPFRIGDRVRVSGYDGHIVAIGLRSFRLATFDGTEVVIPNSVIIDSVVENVTLSPHYRIILDLGLTYATTPEQMKTALDILLDIAKDNPGVDDSQTKASFFGYGDFSLTIRYIYYIDKVKGGYYRTQSEVNMAILERFNASGLNFAFPTQSLYIENMQGSVSIKKEN